MRIRDPKNVHMDPDPWGLRLKKKNYTKKFSTKSFIRIRSPAPSMNYRYCRLWTFYCYSRHSKNLVTLSYNTLHEVSPPSVAVLAAGAPELAPFMADECLLAMPDMEGIDYTMKEYMKLVEKTRECVDRLNSQGGQKT